MVKMNNDEKYEMYVSFVKIVKKGEYLKNCI